MTAAVIGLRCQGIVFRCVLLLAVASELITSELQDGSENLALGVQEQEKYIIPLLSDYVGSGNQLMEFMSAAVVAHALNRTLCLVPFFDGPAKHFGLLWRNGHGLSFGERYSADDLSKFVKVTSSENCLQRCNHKLDATWFLRAQRKPNTDVWDKNSTDQNALNMQWSFVRWTTVQEVANSFPGSNLSCVALGGLFPGLRWRGAYLAVGAYLTSSREIVNAAVSVQKSTIGLETPFLAVHWRFEESFCGGRELGTCFLRCGNGAIVATTLVPEAKEWIEHSHQKCHFHGVKVIKEDIVDAIYDRASASNITSVYLATDGWIRSKQGGYLIKDVVDMLRGRGLTVFGLWKVDGLPNFPKGRYVDSAKLATTFGIANPDEKVSNRMISGVEQEICSRAAVFLGTGSSTWSLAVFRYRLAHRRARAVLQSFQGNHTKTQMEILDQSVHDSIIRQLLEDQHEAGLLCGYHRYFSKAPVNATVETFQDEAPDGWLDLDACEGRIGRGGKCEFAQCN